MNRRELLKATAALPNLERAANYWREHRPASRWADEVALWLARAQALHGANRASP